MKVSKIHLILFRNPVVWWGHKPRGKSYSNSEVTRQQAYLKSSDELTVTHESMGRPVRRQQQATVHQIYLGAAHRSKWRKRTRAW